MVEVLGAFVQIQKSGGRPLFADRFSPGLDVLIGGS